MASNASLLLSKIATIGKLVGDSGTRRRAHAACTLQRPERSASSSPLVPPRAVRRRSRQCSADLPGDIPAALVLVQHVDEKFVPGLGGLAGSAYGPPGPPGAGRRQAGGREWFSLLPSSDHLVFKSATELGYTSEPRDYPYRPSVDVFFESAARRWGWRTVRCVAHRNG